LWKKIFFCSPKNILDDSIAYANWMDDCPICIGPMGIFSAHLWLLPIIKISKSRWIEALIRPAFNGR
jgi:hypothetical protein